MTGYAGTERCAGCHAAQAAAWRGSDHDLAMADARSDALAAPFAGETHEAHGITTTFLTKQGERYVVAESEDGSLREYPVPYTFGTRPLQQVLVDRGSGHLAALHLAWDTRPQAEGGGRWLSLHGDERVPPGDPLHWTGPAGNWNVQCAECHSTGLSLGWDDAAGSYAPRWAEMDVACEACHGPGAQHVAWAETGKGADVLAARPTSHRWAFHADDPIARRTPPATREASGELAVCARCHARRSRIGDTLPGEPFLDGYAPALLERGLYFPDGQIREEVYVWGSFLQSRMHSQGVTCSDCHDPHSLTIEEPDAVCAGCHRLEVFAVRDHHRHPEGSAGASCVACHMPARTYMRIDARRDHGFRIPRPDLTATLGTPEPCTGCHADRSAAWASETARLWWGEPDAHWTSQDPVDRVHADLPPWIRASAVAELAHSSDPRAASTLLEATRDHAPLVRLAAARLGERLPPAARWQMHGPLLSDPRRAVRLEAARSLAGLGPATPSPQDLRRLETALEELSAALGLVRDRPSGQVQRGDLARRLGRHGEAERAYRRALELGPWFVPAAVNLADLLRIQNRDGEGEVVLRASLSQVGPELPESVSLHQALGLLLVRAKRHDAAVPHLGKAAALQPDDPQTALLYGLVLQAVGREDEARPFLERGRAAQR